MHVIVFQANTVFITHKSEIRNPKSEITNPHSLISVFQRVACRYHIGGGI